MNWLTYNKEFIAEFTFGPVPGEKGKIQAAKCSQASLPSYFSLSLHWEVIQEWARSSCVWERAGRIHQPSLQPRLDPHWPAPRDRENVPFSNSTPRIIKPSGSTSCIKSHTSGVRIQKKRIWDLIFAFGEYNGANGVSQHSPVWLGTGKALVEARTHSLP